MWADRMRIAVMGSGGLGGFFGARLAVGRANTVGLPDDYADDRLGFIDTLHPEMMASMAHDLLNGNRLELPWLSGGVVGLGERAGVPTPLNRAVRDVLAVYSDGGGPGRPT
ncbi:MAG: ketopantoate reductase family protein [Rhodoplanes sp.]